MKSGWFSALFAGIFFVTTFSGTALAKEQEVNLAEEATSAILIERDTGEVLFDKNSHEPLPPASMTKIMTMLLIMEALDEERISLTEEVRASERAASMGGSQIFLEPGETMTVEDMLKGIAIASGNDASVAMAEHISGTEEEFVNMMNERAEELGLENTHFVNSNGLPDEDHYSTAADLSKMSQELLNHEQITAFTGLYEDYLREDSEEKFWLVNTNKLVKFYPGVDGLKTGYTSEAEYCLAATAKKQDMRTIAVVMGAESPKERNRQITEMFDYAFGQYQVEKLYEQGTVIDEVKVSKGEKSRVDAVTDHNVSLLTKKGQSIEEVDTEIELESGLSAPINKGDRLGTLTVTLDGERLQEADLVANEEIAEASWWQLFKRTTSQLVGKD
ncbi:D-alanyl-D-alanine carboxypeptidase family protein [Texcoconibacillus texcoconensis]|uniref:serine-type D-Ala-D-Ala carboxypeptidase n=1 Tax=Texcoconibacillus texcoconensis TaxID=1095777 RepID=A0A840QNN0_9BACI|nr:D-alanyl-D-alanine carboxypeptidase family protein [Texcoconibacillus texcoconensis]MBB5172985.1 D-alanyl-D-alanine carboxypeptidase (penicillin-binding protein 5/6) [Texcoconibacillus texcoconensis]